MADKTPPLAMLSKPLTVQPHWSRGPSPSTSGSLCLRSYGVITSSSGSISNPYGYASGYSDAATGLVQFGARYYNPSVGLFTQEDPSGQTEGYLYVGDNPVNGTDATGMSGNPVDVDCSGGGTAASCAGAEAIAEQVTAEECANSGACAYNGVSGDTFCGIAGGVALGVAFIPGVNGVAAASAGVPCGVYELVKALFSL